MTYSQIRDELLRKGVLYLDESFPANSQSLCLSHRRDGVTWKRPGMIVKSGKPQFVVNKTSRCDFDQGALGDCWFIAAAATLASSHWEYFAKVVPDDQSFEENYAGIFHFRFWSYGMWQEVLIDDYLPCNESGLLYCSNREEPNEFWTALLEKAYAKFYGSYENLRGGYIHYALVNLTGGITEVLPVNPARPSPVNLYNTLMRSHRMNAFIGAGIFKPRNSKPGEIKRRNGLYMGHAYSVTGFETLRLPQETAHLLRVRNPWGQGEWNGKWSDRWLAKAELTEENRRRLYRVLKKDGEFWISIEDFVKNFNEIQLCHLEPDSMTSEVAVDMKRDDWRMSSYHGAWRETDPPEAGSCGCCCPSQQVHTGGQFANPQYYIRLTSPATLVISLMEKEARRSLTPQVYINFFIYKLRGDIPEPITHATRRMVRLVGRGSGKFAYYKEVARRFALEPGCYVVVPETYRDDAEAEFLLRIFSKGEVESRELQSRRISTLEAISISL